MERVVPYEKSLKMFSRSLRRNMTDCERKLWFRFRGKQIAGPQFYRQKPIGSYVADFYCSMGELIIELDGGQHFTADGRGRDQIRDQSLRRMGIRTLRFSDRDGVENPDGILEMIAKMLNEQISPGPSLRPPEDESALGGKEGDLK